MKARNATRSALIRLWQGATGDDGAALGNLPPLFTPKPRAGRALQAQEGLPLTSGSEKDMGAAGAFLGGAAE
jgi:hypothetical protein